METHRERDTQRLKREQSRQATRCCYACASTLLLRIGDRHSKWPSVTLPPPSARAKGRISAVPSPPPSSLIPSSATRTRAAAVLRVREHEQSHLLLGLAIAAALRCERLVELHRLVGRPSMPPAAATGQTISTHHPSRRISAATSDMSLLS